MKIEFILILVFLSFSVASAGIFGPDPTPTQQIVEDTWAPVDKCWTYQPIECTSSYCHSEMQAIVYFITYVNQNGHHKIEQVDIDTWYNVTSTFSFKGMYYQGAQ